MFYIITRKLTSHNFMALVDRSAFGLHCAAPARVAYSFTHARALCRVFSVFSPSNTVLGSYRADISAAHSAPRQRTQLPLPLPPPHPLPPLPSSPPCSPSPSPRPRTQLGRASGRCTVATSSGLARGALSLCRCCASPSAPESCLSIDRCVRLFTHPSLCAS